MASNMNGVGECARAVADLTSRPRRDAAGEPASGAAGPGGLPGSADAVAITDVADRVRAAEAGLVDVPVVDSKRVEQIREAIGDGTYRVAPERIARKLVDLEAALARSAGPGDAGDV